jgi:hypothetical protein
VNGIGHLLSQINEVGPSLVVLERRKGFVTYMTIAYLKRPVGIAAKPGSMP